MDELIKKYMKESTISGSYPDEGGIAGDDDAPTGNIIMGNRYERKPYHNRLNRYKSIWDIDDKANYQYDWFPDLEGMEARISYSKTLFSMEKMFPDLFKHTRDVPDDKVQQGYDNKGKTHKKVKNALGK